MKDYKQLDKSAFLGNIRDLRSYKECAKANTL